MQLGLDLSGTLAHPDQAVVPRLRRLMRIHGEPGPIVVDSEAESFSGGSQGQLDRARTGMLDGVGDRLLCDSQHVVLDVGWQAECSLSQPQHEADVPRSVELTRR